MPERGQFFTATGENVPAQFPLPLRDQPAIPSQDRDDLARFIRRMACEFS